MVPDVANVAGELVRPFVETLIALFSARHPDVRAEDHIEYISVMHIEELVVAWFMHLSDFRKIKIGNTEMLLWSLDYSKELEKLTGRQYKAISEASRQAADNLEESWRTTPGIVNSIFFYNYIQE